MIRSESTLFNFERSFAAFLIVAGCAVVLAGCGGGGDGGGGGSGAATVTQTSFQGSPSTIGGPIPSIFRDEVLLVTFSSPIDATNFGGLYTAASATQPTTFLGTSSQSLSGVPYNAFADQAAARAAVQLYDDATSTQITNVVIGRSAVNSNVLVIDPVVNAGNPFSIPPSLGFGTNLQVDVFIPAASGLRSGGTSVLTFGALPPQLPPAFAPQPPPSTLLRTGTSFAPDTVPPIVVEISTNGLNGAATTTPIADNDVIRVTFSEPIDPATINLQTNLIVRNLSVQTSTDPSGIIVPTILTSDASGTVYFLTPQPSFGQGPFQIRVEVGGSGLALADQIKDLASGASATQNSLANSATVTFTTIFNAAAVAGVSINERFDGVVNNTTQDTTFVGRFNNARWNVNNSGRLEAFPISGSSTPGTPLGTRMQFSIQPNTPGPVTAFFSPFDSNTPPNQFTFTPNGGSHSQFLYSAGGTEIQNQISDTVELVEWGGAFTQGVPFAFTYAGFQMRLSHTTADPLGTFGLVTVFASNWDFDNPQNEFIMPTTHPGSLPLNETPITVVASSPYVVPAISSTFVPYPSLNPLFDFDDFGRTEINALSNMAQQPNLLVDIDIPAPVGASNNFVFGNFPMTPIPIRRLNGAPGSTLAGNSDNVACHARFTFVGRNSSARSIFYDLGALAQDANFQVLTMIPSLANRPAGTTIVVRAEATDAVSGGMPVAGGNTSPVTPRVIYDRNGNFNAANLNLMDGRRFIRIIIELESNTMTNVGPFLDGYVIGYTF